MGVSAQRESTGERRRPVNPQRLKGWQWLLTCLCISGCTRPEQQTDSYQDEHEPQAAEEASAGSPGEPPVDSTGVPQQATHTSAGARGDPADDIETPSPEVAVPGAHNGITLDDDCGGTACTTGFQKCCAGAACGQRLPNGKSRSGEEYFRAPGTCEPLNQAGEPDPDCPVSPEFCDDEKCVEFTGCRRVDGSCGYWLSGVATTVGGEETVSLRFDFGCADATLVR